VFTGCPSFLRASLRHARTDPDGYRDPGHKLGQIVRDLSPWGLEDEEWLAVIDTTLAPLIEAGDRAGLIAWLRLRFPVVMRQVPPRRADRFAEGFENGFLECD
jgi:hypothetical protein